jgi:polysaccharide biosynthesis protein PslA
MTFVSPTERQPPIGMAKRRMRRRLGVALVCLDLIAIVVATGIAAMIRFGAVSSEDFFRLLSIISPIYLIVAANTHAFSLSEATGRSSWRSRNKALASFVISCGFVLGIVFSLKMSESLSRVMLALTVISGLFALTVARALFARLSHAMLGNSILHEVIIVSGTDLPLQADATIVRADRLGLAPNANDPLMLDAIGRAIEGADRVIVACEPEHRLAWTQALRGAGTSVEVLAPEIDALGALGVNRFHGLTTAVVAIGPLATTDRALKRALDLVIVALAAAPVLLLGSGIALAIKLDSKGPVFFVQTRVGQGNRLFRMYKFRTMRAESGDQRGDTSTQRLDPRITWLGNILRRLSLDELPQLLNVVKNEMSIVGPRPHAIGSTADNALFWEIESHYWDRHAAKPGLTGLAQVKGLRGSTERRTDLSDRLDADLAYLDAWTIWRDLAIIGRTFGVIFHDRAF